MVPEPDKVLIVFEKTFVKVAPVMEIPKTVDDTPVELSVLIVFPLILTTVEVLEQDIPVTFPPAPVEDKPVTVFEDIVAGLAVFAELPIVMPVMAP